MTGNRLKLISDKTPALLAGSRRIVSMSKDNHLGVGNYDNFFKGRVKNLGVYTDATLCMVKHIDHISRSAYLKIRRIRSIRHLLTTKAAPQLMCSFVLNWLDYCISLLIDINCDPMYGLQNVKNQSKLEHARPLILKALRWVAVKERIKCKISTTAVRFSGGNLPPYLSHCLSVDTPSRTLRSSSYEK